MLQCSVLFGNVFLSIHKQEQDKIKLLFNHYLRTNVNYILHINMNNFEENVILEGIKLDSCYTFFLNSLHILY